MNNAPSHHRPSLALIMALPLPHPPFFFFFFHTHPTPCPKCLPLLTTVSTLSTPPSPHTLSPLTYFNTNRPSLALIMATEPDATLLAQEDPSAFYVPGSAPADVEPEAVLQLWGQAGGGAFDGYAGFLTSLKSAGGWRKAVGGSEWGGGRQRAAGLWCRV
jgi:hypothetical protein